MSSRHFIFVSLLPLVSMLLGWQAASIGQEEMQAVTKAKVPILKLLRLRPTSESIDYVQNKTQFQLHTLLTEQRHKKTWDLSKRIQKNPERGLRLLFSVDEDIVEKLGLSMLTQKELEDLINYTLAENSQYIEKKGKAAFGLIMNIIMKKARGKVNSKKVTELINQKL